MASSIFKLFLSSIILCTMLQPYTEALRKASMFIFNSLSHHNLRLSIHVSDSVSQPQFHILLLDIHTMCHNFFALIWFFVADLYCILGRTFSRSKSFPSWYWVSHKFSPWFTGSIPGKVYIESSSIASFKSYMHKRKTLFKNDSLWVLSYLICWISNTWSEDHLIIRVHIKKNQKLLFICDIS